MKILYSLRRDGRRKRGGDVLQAEYYATQMRGLGHQVVISYGFFAHDEFFDVVHVFNIDRPWEALRQAFYSKDHGAKIVLGALHHPRHDVERYQRERSFGIDRLIWRCGGGYDITEQLKAIARAGMAFSCADLVMACFGSTNACSQKLISIADAVQVLSESEAVALGSIFHSLPSVVHTVHNGSIDVVPALFESLPAVVVEFIKKYPKFAAIVGRVEPRKNQIGYIDSVSDLCIPTLFVGGGNLNHRAYFDRFNRIVGLSDYYVHVEHVDQSVVRSILQLAHFHASVSLFECTPLVDLEAYMSGANVIASGSSFSHSYGDGIFTYCDPWDRDSIRQAVLKVWSMDRSGVVDPKFRELFTWVEAGRQLSYLYEKIIK